MKYIKLVKIKTEVTFIPSEIEETHVEWDREFIGKLKGCVSASVEDMPKAISHLIKFREGNLINAINYSEE